MQANKLTVGGYIKYQCSRCKLELGHTIIAMIGGQPARVRCETCKTERNFRVKKILADKKAPITRVKIHHPDLYRSKLHEAADKTPKKYRIDASLETGDAVDHVKFGRGVVLKIIHPDRADIIFQDDTRTLACKVD